MQENFRILKPFLRGLPIIILVMVFAVITAKKYLSYVTPMYESTTKLKLADVSEGVPSSNLFKDFDVFASSNKIAAEIEVIKSSLLLNKALDQMDFDVEIYRSGKLRDVELYGDSPIKAKGSFHHKNGYDVRYSVEVKNDTSYTLSIPGTLKPYKGTMDKLLVIPNGQILISLDTTVIQHHKNVKIKDTYQIEFLSREKLISKINKNLDIVSVDKDVAIIRISYKSPVPEKAAVLVNKLAEYYIHDYIETKYKAAETTVHFLDKQIDDVATKLSNSESTIQQYRDDHGITNIRQETETDLRKISQLKIQLTNVRMSLNAIEELNNYMQSGKDDFLSLAPNFEAFTDLLSTEIVKKIKQLQSEKRDLLLVYTPQEERVKVVDHKIDDLKSYLLESIKNTRRNLEIKHNQLKKDIEDAERVFVDVPEKERILTIMNREFEIYQQSYNFLNEKKIEAEIAQAAKIAFHRIISPALISKDPVSPNKTIIVIVSAILGLFGSTTLIYLIHMGKAKVNDAYTIEKNSSIPIALLTPYLPNPQSIKAHFLKEAIQLELKGIVGINKVIVVSAFSTHESHNFHVLNLAESFIQQGRKVLLIDVDGRLKHKAESNNIEYVDFTLLEYDALSKTALEEKIQPYRHIYDVVLVMNQVLDNQTKSLLFMSIADSNLIVLDSRKTPAKRILEMDLVKEEFAIPNVWFVLNKSGYNPSIVQEGKWLLKKVQQFKRKG